MSYRAHAPHEPKSPPRPRCPLRRWEEYIVEMYGTDAERTALFSILDGQLQLALAALTRGAYEERQAAVAKNATAALDDRYANPLHDDDSDPEKGKTGKGKRKQGKIKGVAEALNASGLRALGWDTLQIDEACLIPLGTHSYRLSLW